LLQFLGLAERLFTPEYGKLVQLKKHAEQLRARSEQYGSTLDALASDILSDGTHEVKATLATIGEAEDRLATESASLRQRRTAMLVSARDRVVLPTQRGRINELSEERAKILVELEELRHRVKATAQRGDEVAQYESDLASELEKINRAEDAGSILADLRITHCPACDQTVANRPASEGHCFLCHQELPNELLVEELGVVRLRFERDRLSAELTEARDLTDLLRREEKRILAEIASGEERLKMIDSELAPARLAISTLVQEEVSAIDVALGELNERRRQLGRISAALQIGHELEERIAKLMEEIRPLQAAVNEAARSTDFDSAAADLEDGMNEYLGAINKLRPGVWRHSPVALDISRGDFRFLVGKRRWHAALGGTDSLYFLMAYHYGLLSLSPKLQRHYPGLSIIDVPGEFAGEAVEDKENFIVQPFVDLLARKEFAGVQLIITGASFAGLQGVHRRHLRKVYVN
jgi:DNA repair exonuclease SbcCD ATPase subunit